MIFIIFIPEDLFDMLYLRSKVTEMPHLEQALPYCMAISESGCLNHNQAAKHTCILHSVCRAHYQKTGSMTEVATALLAVSFTMHLLPWLWDLVPNAAPTCTIWALHGVHVVLNRVPLCACVFFTRGNTTASVPAGSCHVAYLSGYTSALSAP